MKAVTATEAKARFGDCLDQARTEAVAINRNGKTVVVMVPSDEYERLQALDDTFWALQARMAEKEGYLGPEAAMKFIESKM
jgi:prevent-host-death family protein